MSVLSIEAKVRFEIGVQSISLSFESLIPYNLFHSNGRVYQFRKFSKVNDQRFIRRGREEGRRKETKK